MMTPRHMSSLSFFAIRGKTLKKMECAVCVGKVARTKTVRCPSCEYECCRKCFETYLEANPLGCMNCGARFEAGTLLEMLPRAYAERLGRQCKERELFRREQALMPSTAPFVEVERRRRAALAEMRSLNEMRVELRRKLAYLDSAHAEAARLASREQRKLLQAGEESPVAQRCPREGCSGWLSSGWTCTACEAKVCETCLCVAEEGHVCDPNAVQSVRAVREQSTPCPQCSTAISRTSGCSAMYCIVCKICFDYESGVRIRGLVHNPELMDEQRRAGTLNRDPADIPCGGMVSYVELTRRDPHPTLVRMYNLVHHVQHSVLPRLLPPPSTRPLRIAFMMGELTEERFKERLFKMDRDTSYTEGVRAIMLTVEQTFADELRSFVLSAGPPHTTIQNGLAILRIANGSLFELGTAYNRKAPLFSGFDL